MSNKVNYQDLASQLAQEVTLLGYEWVGMDSLPGTDLLRLFVDKSGGITMGELTQIDRHLRAWLPVAYPAMRFRLEVSSPGLDRILFTLEHCERFIGHTITVKMPKTAAGTAERRRWQGKLLGIEATYLLIEAEGETIKVDFNETERVRLVPEPLKNRA